MTTSKGRHCSHLMQISRYSAVILILIGLFYCHQQQQNTPHYGVARCSELGPPKASYHVQQKRSVVLGHNNYQQPQLYRHQQNGLAFAPQLNDGPIADIVAIKEGADLDLMCPINIKSPNDDLIFSWTCGDEPANVRSSRIHVTESGKLRIRSAKVGDSCNYRCEAIDGFGTVSVMVKVVIVDKKIIEQQLNRTITTNHNVTPHDKERRQQQSAVSTNKLFMVVPGKRDNVAGEPEMVKLETINKSNGLRNHNINQYTLTTTSTNNQLLDTTTADNKDSSISTGISTGSMARHREEPPPQRAPHVLQIFSITKDFINVTRLEYPSVGIRIREGGSIILGCKFLSNPLPTNVQWYKDNEQLLSTSNADSKLNSKFPTSSTRLNNITTHQEASLNQQQHHHQQHRYVFYNLTKVSTKANTTGKYSCLASNHLGEAMANFILDIVIGGEQQVVESKSTDGIQMNKVVSSNLNRNNTSSYHRKVELTPAFAYTDVNTTLRLECSCNYSTLAPQIQWLKEYTGPMPQSMAEAHNKGLIYLEDTYYHNLNWPRIISYEGKSFNSVLVLRKAKSTHSGRYLCFAAYPPLNEPLKYHSAASYVYIHDDSGDLISNGGKNYLPVLSNAHRLQRSYMTAQSNVVDPSSDGDGSISPSQIAASSLIYTADTGSSSRQLANGDRQNLILRLCDSWWFVCGSSIILLTLAGVICWSTRSYHEKKRHMVETQQDELSNDDYQHEQQH